MITDEMLCEAASRSNDIFLDFLSHDCTNDHSFSLAFERKIKRLKRKADHPILHQVLNRAASILLALVVGSGVWLTFDTQARAAFFGWVKEIYQEFFVYRFSEPNASSFSTAKYRLNMLPPEYTEMLSTETEYGETFLYQNNAGQFLQFEYVNEPTKANFYVDRTDTIHKKVEVQGVSADLFLSNNENVSSVIMWTNHENVAFYISAFLDQEALIGLANEIEKIF